jgi:hypothetical protein
MKQDIFAHQRDLGEGHHFVQLVYTAIVSLNSLDFLSGVWGGAKLAHVLELVGISKLTSTTKSGGKHVEFVSIDKCKVTCHSE